jgi:hypothetical protein
MGTCREGHPGPLRRHLSCRLRGHYARPASATALPGRDLAELLTAARRVAETLNDVQRRLGSNELFQLPDAFANFVVADLADVLRAG